MKFIEQTDFLNVGRERLAQALEKALNKRGVRDVSRDTIEEALRDTLIDAFPELQAIDELRAADVPEVDWPKRPAWPGAKEAGMNALTFLRTHYADELVSGRFTATDLYRMDLSLYKSVASQLKMRARSIHEVLPRRGTRSARRRQAMKIIMGER